jgi:hypothetical protein
VIHAEYLYLMGRAELTRDAAARAHAEGEVFHSVLPYVPLSNGLEATAWFSQGSRYLKLRHPPSLIEEERVAATFQIFFDGAYTRLPDVTLGARTISEAHAPIPPPKEPT